MRSYDPADATAVLAINEECVPEVGGLTAERLAYFAEKAGLFAVVEVDEQVVGFLVGLDEYATEYPSPNYAWFSERYDSFGYIDRIALSASARGLGLGPDLYRAFEAWAYGHGKPVLVAEVNTIPDNPRSHRFHELFGFRELERTRPYGPDEEVAMYEKRLD
ncbi:MAG: GNAT family N-acetyltransferase [Acidimicrobiia bacterium]|nr:GNAT family N-acetyltransferase [Acidimicrobiia bacterium]